MEEMTEKNGKEGVNVRVRVLQLKFLLHFSLVSSPGTCMYKDWVPGLEETKKRGTWGRLRSQLVTEPKAA